MAEEIKQEKKLEEAEATETAKSERTEIRKKEMYKLIAGYLQEHSLVESNILSFNDFINRRLQKIVNEINEDIPREEVNLFLGKIKVGKPQLIEADGSIRKILPTEARLRKLTYSAPVELEVSIGGKEYNSFEIGKVPVMVRSSCCNLNGMSKQELIANYEDPADPSGYFIINGNERVLVMLEDLAQNQPFVETTPKGRMLRLYSSRGSYRIPISVTQTSDGMLLVSFSRFKNLPAILLIKALGITKDSEIASMIGKTGEDVLVTNLYEYAKIQNNEQALFAVAEEMSVKGMKKEVLDRVKLRLDSALLSHIGTKAESRVEKAMLLCKLVKQFLVSKQLNLESDKDHYANKRVRLSGDLLTDLFRVNLTIFIRDLQRNLQKIAKKKKFYSVKSLAKSTLFSHRIESAFATGNWIGQRSGVTQNMDKTNRMAMISQLQRVISLLPSEQENFKARTLHPTHYGRFCPIETPEGTSIGLRKNLAMLAKVSTAVRTPEKEMIAVLEKSGLKKHEKEITDFKDVILNGCFMGQTDSVQSFINTLKEKRRAQELPLELSIRYDKALDTIFLCTDIGRVLRPLIIIKEGEPALKLKHLEAVQRKELNWNDLINLSLIEYVDAAEEDNLLVAKDTKDITNEHTHLELDPITMLGLNVAVIPYGNHDQSSRLGKVGRANKQALGLYSANYLDLIDTDVSILHYPQEPIVRSFAYSSANTYPSGQNVIVAIMPYEGYNMSDAIVINKSSVERGLGRSTYFRPYTSVELHYTGTLKDEICIPGKDVSGYRTEESYRHLEDDGIIYPEADVSGGDVIIGKVSPPKFMLEMEEISLARARKENSTTMKQRESGIIDSVFLTINGEGHYVAQVRVRNNRLPELGDKFASPHGQKGVRSLIAHEEDLPFTARGVKPDLIFNPHGIPSRLTVGYLIELISGKIGCLKGKIIDGTAFKKQNTEELEQQLINLGFRADGKETLYDGLTGKPLEAKIFIGNMYYLKLKYMVANKIQTRGTGKITLLTRQPIEGRARGGALRLGEMEKDALVGHGASLLLKERFSSDNVLLHICPKCGAFGVRDKIHKKDYCPICNSQKLEPLEISYASKLLMEELMSLHLFPRFKLKNKYDQ